MIKHIRDSMPATQKRTYSILPSYCYCYITVSVFPLSCIGIGPLFMSAAQVHELLYSYDLHTIISVNLVHYNIGIELLNHVRRLVM